MPDSVYESILALAAERLLELRLTRQISIPSPAPINDWFYTVPGGVILELINVQMQLTTDATAGNRSTAIRINDQDGNQVARWGAAGSTAPSTGNSLGWHRGFGATTTTGATSSPLPTPAFPLMPGFVIRSTTGSFGVTDQYSNIFLEVCQWSETDIVQETGVIADQIQSLYGREVTGR